MVDRPVGLAATRRYRRLEFSFSGLKTAVKRYVQQRNREVDSSSGLSSNEVADICASFQRVVVGSLLDRTFRAARQYGARSIGIAGGVSANSRLRDDATARANQEELPLFLPSLSLATDNAAMIGLLAEKLMEQGIAPAELEDDIESSWAIGTTDPKL